MYTREREQEFVNRKVQGWRGDKCGRIETRRMEESKEESKEEKKKRRNENNLKKKIKKKEEPRS